MVSRVKTKLTAEIRDDDNDGQARSSTQLFGTQPVRIVSVDDTIGLFNFVDAGGAVAGLKLTGFDAGTQARADDTFGDGLAAFLSNLTVFQNLIHQTDRAGVANFGGFMSLGSNMIFCAAFELEGEPFLGNNYVFEEHPGNVCGCEDSEGCIAVSTGLAAPTAIEPEQ